MPLKENLNPILPFIDFTYLKDEENQKDYDDFLQQAAQTEVACLCVYPKKVAEIKRRLPHKKIATVINFPSGDHDLTHIKKELDLANEADEIDVVFPYPLYLAGNKNASFQKMKALLSLIPKDKIIKVIIESGRYTKAQDIEEICSFLITQPIAFIKTSTGKIKQGASLQATKTILHCLKGTQMGLKVSGGIRTPFEAMSYIELAKQVLPCPLSSAHFRIGASTLFTA